MITIRQGCPGDHGALQEVLVACGMCDGIVAEGCLVALEGDSPVGLVRLESGAGIPYVRPIAILPAQQGKGLGTRLLRIVTATYLEVKVVARGPSTEFYRRLGFERITWEEIYSPFQQDCEQCLDRAECKPCPMRHQALSTELG
jgi:N-acetylglutamate synthase-like GNAT family acetyltransferase